MILSALSLLLACSDKTADPSETATDVARDVTDDSGQDINVTGIYEETPRNLIVFSIDTFRRDYLARYGNTEGLTPFLDGLTSESVVLDDHTSCSNWTFPSVLCTLSGRSNLETGFMPRLSSNTREQAPAERWSLAGHLKDRGYYTTFHITNSWLSDEWLNDQGYSYQAIPGTGNATEIYQIARDHLLESVDTEADKWMMHVHVKEPHAAFNPPEEYLDGLDALPDIPWDLTNKDYHYDVAMDGWEDLSPEEQELLEAHLLVRYAGEVRYLDDQLAAIWADLEQRGLLDDTLVLFFSDHGEAFWEHDVHTHAYTLYAEENAAVAFLWREGLVPMAWSGPTNHTDLAPTVLTAMGLDVPDGVTGLSVGSGTDDRLFYSDSVARWGMVQGVRKQNWRMMYRWSTGEKWLYDLDADPLETDNLYAPDHPQVIELWEFLTPRMEQAELLVTEFTPKDPGP